MPELPEVETVIRSVRPRIEGREIRDYRSRWAKNSTPAPARLRDRIVGRRVKKLTRRGKHILWHLDDDTFLGVHLRMSGRFEWRTPGTANRWARAWWDFDSGDRLLFCDARKFGTIRHASTIADITGPLGVEPLSRGFTVRSLQSAFAETGRALKPTLLDQRTIAGLGNIYVDEALFAAGLHPLRAAHTLGLNELTRLHAAIREVLRAGIRNNGASIDWVYPGGSMQDAFRVYGRADQPCKICDTPIVALRVAQRGTHICPACQRT
ncbi:MAG: DNA-formamidopyrimidine glycosylase [Phycisphaerae bacterium]